MNVPTVAFPTIQTQNCVHACSRISKYYFSLDSIATTLTHQSIAMSDWPSDGTCNGCANAPFMTRFTEMVCALLLLILVLPLMGIVWAILKTRGVVPTLNRDVFGSDGKCQKCLEFNLPRFGVISSLLQNSCIRYLPSIIYVFNRRTRLMKVLHLMCPDQRACSIRNSKWGIVFLALMLVIAVAVMYLAWS